jgi:hypothetical protein
LTLLYSIPVFATRGFGDDVIRNIAASIVVHVAEPQMGSLATMLLEAKGIYFSDVISFYIVHGGLYFIKLPAQLAVMYDD